MASFFQFQRVRIVRAQGMVAHYLGTEQIISEPSDIAPGYWRLAGIARMSWHPDCLEPLTYTPDAEDLATQEAQDFRIIAPTHCVPADFVMQPGVVP
jgi:hypothetical protein